MSRRLAFPIVTLIALASAPAVASPTTAEVAHAQRLVRLAAVLEQRGDLAGAQDDLAQAMALDPAPHVVLALAKVRQKLGHLVEAREALTATVYGAASSDAAPVASPARAECQQMFSDLGRRIPRARIAVDARPAIRTPSVSLTIDGGALPAGAEQLPIPVNPGRHVLEVSAPEMQSQTIVFEAVEMAEKQIAVHLGAPRPTSPALVALPQPVAPPLSSPDVPTGPAPVAPLPPLAPVGLDRDERIAAARRARFSVGRFFLESLGSALVGSLAAYGTFKAACGNQACLGGSLEALGVNVVVTPLTVWGIGEATGGDGGLGWAFLGGLAAFSGYTAGTTDPTLPLVIGVVLMPFTSALIYEFSSDANAHRMLGPKAMLTPTFAPLYGPSSNVVGGAAGLAGRF
jgi:hypothetical protein